MPSLLALPTARSHHRGDLERGPQHQRQNHKMLLNRSPMARAGREPPTAAVAAAAPAPALAQSQSQSQSHWQWQASGGKENFTSYAAGPPRSEPGNRASADGGNSTTLTSNKLKKKNRGSAPPQLPSHAVYEYESLNKARKQQQTMSATTVTVRPLHQFPLDTRAAHSGAGPPLNGASPRISMPPAAAAYQAYPMYTGLQTASTPRTPRYRDSAPVPLKTPRRLSGSPKMAPTMEAKMHGQTVVTTVELVDPHARMVSHSKPRYAPPQRRVARKPGEMFAALPNEVIGLILEKLKQLHLEAGSHSCATCWMRDLCNVCLASQRCAQFARAALYGDVQLVGPDSAAHRKKLKLPQGSRMLMLRRTLRSTPHLAALVRRLKVPRLELLDNGSVPKGALSPDQYEDLIATLVMACPNLEKLVGPTSNYGHSFTKLFHALSTRANLKEMDWIIEPLAGETQRRQQSSPPRSNGSVVPSGLDLQLGNAFLGFHNRWAELRSLSIHCLPGGTLAPNGLFTELLRRLPSLQHLHLCNLPVDAFNDSNLLSLPPLQTLSLSHISGITANGFSAFATRKNSHSLRTLHLRHTPLSSLPSLARIFSNLAKLTNFSLIQAYPPVMPETDSFALWMMPYLASPTVSKLHWDITCVAETANPCDDILARSIAAGGFPQLKRLRTPNDLEGVFQAVCRPVERIDFASDRFRRLGGGQSTSSLSKMDQRKTLLSGNSPQKSQSSRPPRCTDLCTARLAAQARLEQARDVPKFSVNVTSEEGPTAEFRVGGYMGTVGSQIEYYLHPDPGSSDEKGGQVDLRDLGADNGETITDGKEGCTGRWNMAEGVVADKKEKEYWWHTERGRWKGIELV
jgi:hypothetical protein